MMDDGRSLAVTLLMVNDVPANQEIFEPLARKRRDCDWWIHDLMIETFLSDFKEEIVNIMMTAQTLAWRRKGAQGLTAASIIDIFQAAQHHVDKVLAVYK